VDYLVDLAKVIIESERDLKVIGKKGDTIDEAFIKKIIMDKNKVIKDTEAYIKVTLNGEGHAIVTPATVDVDGKAKTLYSGSVEITYQVATANIIENPDLSDDPLDKQPQVDNDTDLGNKIHDHNPNFNPDD